MHFSTRDHREKREESCPVHSTLLLPSFVPPATGLYLTARHTPWHPAQPTLPRYSPAFYSFSISSILSSFSISSATYSFSPFSTPFSIAIDRSALSCFLSSILHLRCFSRLAFQLSGFRSSFSTLVTLFSGCSPIRLLLLTDLFSVLSTTLRGCFRDLCSLV